MGYGKQAKVLTEEQIQSALDLIQRKDRHKERNTVMLLFSVKAGLRVGEISNLQWGMVTGSDGLIGDDLHLPNWATKGGVGGRKIPLNKDLKEALIVLYSQRLALGDVNQDDWVVYSEWGPEKVNRNSLCVWFHRLYTDRLKFWGCSSHSGRRTFITKAARMINKAGGSLRDVQMLAGHKNLGTTQRYIEGNQEAQSRVVDLL